MSEHVYEKNDAIGRLDACLNEPLGALDTVGLFERIRGFPLQKGIAGAVVEQCVFGYPPDSSQDADLVIVDAGERVKTELKTTGMVLDGSRSPRFTAKEPMSITAVGVYEIGGESFETSHFWRKLEHMLIVYYHYTAQGAVPAYEYRSFPVKGYEFHTFSAEEEQTLRSDWEHVRALCADIVSRHPGPRTAGWKDAVKGEYIALHGQLRRVLSFVDLAPKFPPRFRLKRSVVSTMIAKHFGEELEQLPGRYTCVADIDVKCRELTEQYRGKTIAQLARMFRIPCAAGRAQKAIAERIVIAMFGGTAPKLNQIELFKKYGLVAKSVVVTSTGKRTEDMKLFHLDLAEMEQTQIWGADGALRDLQFEDSQLYTYFADHEFLCILFEQPPRRAPAESAGTLGEARFLGFKRLVFTESFIDTTVRRLWEDTRAKILGGTLVDVVVQRNGRARINRSGGVSSAPNFMKSRDNDVFLRGSGTDASPRYKVESVNGVRMLPQYVWIRGCAIVKQLEEAPEL